MSQRKLKPFEILRALARAQNDEILSFPRMRESNSDPRLRGDDVRRALHAFTRASVWVLAVLAVAGALSGCATVKKKFIRKTPERQVQPVV